MPSTDVSYTSNSYNYQNNPACVISNRYGINAVDVKNDILLTGDNLGHLSLWDLDLQSKTLGKKLDNGIINVKFGNDRIISQSKGDLSLINMDFDTVFQSIDSKSCTFAKFVLLNNKSVIAHPISQVKNDITIFSISNDRFIEINRIKNDTGKDLGSLHVLKGISEFQFIAAYEIGSILTFDIRKLDIPITEPIQINTTAPIHSIESFNDTVYAGTAEGELYSINGKANKCYVMKSISQPGNLGIGNIVYYNEYLFLACWDGSVRVLNSKDYIEKIIFHGHSCTVTDIFIDYTNNVLFTSGIDGRICIWDKLFKYIN